MRPSNRPAWMDERAYGEKVEAARKRRKLEAPPPAPPAPALPPVNTSAASRAVYVEGFQRRLWPQVHCLPAPC